MKRCDCRVAPAGVRRGASLVALGVILAVLGSCGERGCQDGWEPPPGRSHALFLASGALQPSSAVMVLAQVPPLRYAGGVIEITGGSELMVVPPQAWREFTGTALSLEDAERELARARRLERSLHALGVSADALMELLRRRLDTHVDAPGSPSGACAPSAPSAPSAGHASLPPASGARASKRARDQGPGAAAGREQQLVAISDRALDQLQDLLLQAASTAAAERSNTQDATAVADADALAAADERTTAHDLAMTVARLRGDGDAPARERAYQARQQECSSTRERSDAQRRDDLGRRLAAADASMRQRIASIHQHAAHELLQCCCDDESSGQEPTAGAHASLGATPAGPGAMVAGEVDGHGH